MEIEDFNDNIRLRERVRVRFYKRETTEEEKGQLQLYT